MRIPAVVGALALATLAACGDGTDGSATPVGAEQTGNAEQTGSAGVAESEMVVELDPSAGEAQLESAADVLTERIDLLGVTATIGRVGPTVTITLDAADEALVRSALDGDGRVEFRPVQGLPDTQLADPAPPERLGELREDGEVVLADAEGTLYRLGPVRLTGAAIEGVAVGLSPSGTWQLEPVLLPGPDGIDAFNEVAAACFTGARECPARGASGSGQLAIVLDGAVLSAPSVNAAEFEPNQIQISGEFTETEARALAAQMGAGARPVTWTVAY